MKEYNIDELKEMNNAELETCCGGKYMEDRGQDALYAMFLAYQKAGRMRNAGKKREALEYLDKVAEQFRNYGGNHPKPEYDGIYFSDLIDLS